MPQENTGPPSPAALPVEVGAQLQSVLELAGSRPSRAALSEALHALARACMAASGVGP